eukprot:Gb_28938 [translate_table: standard]
MPATEKSNMSAIPKRIAVFKTGYDNPYTETTYGGYGEMLANSLKEPGEIWDIFPVIDGKFPSEKELNEYGGFVITCSSTDAHENEEWILKLCDVLKYLYESEKKLLGICFGHQVLSRALGGKTGRSSVGWELGLKDVHLKSDLVHKFSGLELPPVLKVIESHQDQVGSFGGVPICHHYYARIFFKYDLSQDLLRTLYLYVLIIIASEFWQPLPYKVSCVPPNGFVLGYSTNTEIEMFAIGNRVLGIQFHPEF